MTEEKLKELRVWALSVRHDPQQPTIAYILADKLLAIIDELLEPQSSNDNPHKAILP